MVELFTSQGCSSCPPADRLLGQLAGRDDVIALGFHIDYWDYIGWADPFALPEATARQRRYGRALGLPSIFTPQMVIDGTVSTVGSRPSEVLRAIERAPARRAERVPVTVTMAAASGPGAADRLDIRIGAGPAPDAPAPVLLIRYEDGHVTDVARGENRGRTLTDAHVVREIRRLGTWTGAPLALTVPMEAGQTDDPAAPGGHVVLVQRGEAGPILGVAEFTAR